MKIWRIYRLPGSRENWHVDSGEDTQVVNVQGIEIYCHAISVDIPAGHPRAWIEIKKSEADFHIIGGRGLWTAVAAAAVAS